MAEGTRRHGGILQSLAAHVLPHLAVLGSVAFLTVVVIAVQHVPTKANSFDDYVKEIKGEHILVAVLVDVLLGCLGYVVYFVKTTRREMCESGCVLKPFIDIVAGYADLTPEMRKLYARLHGEICPPASGPGSGRGGIVFTADAQHYVKQLLWCVDGAAESYKAVLVPPNGASWFFKASHGLTVKEKQDYLESVNGFKKRARGRAIRILLFPDDDLARDFQSLSIAERKLFFKLHRHVELYQIDPKKFAEFQESAYVKRAMREDYALVDDSLITEWDFDKEEVRVYLNTHRPEYGDLFTVCLNSPHAAQFRNTAKIRKELAGL